MGRFNHLELDSKPQAKLRIPPVQRVVNEPSYLEFADARHREARFEPALKYYSRALQFNPNLPRAWFGQVWMLIELGEPKEAELWAQKALQLYRDDPDLLAGRAVALAHMCEPKRALEFSDASLSCEGSGQWAWLGRGEVMLATGQTNHTHCFMRARIGRPTDWFLKLNIARAYHRYGHHGRSLDWAKQARDLAPERAYTWLVAGDCRVALGERRQARISYEQALLLDSNLEAARLGLAKLDKRNPLETCIETLRQRFRTRA